MSRGESKTAPTTYMHACKCKYESASPKDARMQVCAPQGRTPACMQVCDLSSMYL